MNTPIAPLSTFRPTLPAQIQTSAPLAIQLAGDRAYWRAVHQFFDWCEAHGLVDLRSIRPMHVSAYVEQMQVAPPTVKQRLAAIRRCFDWLVSGGVLEINPAGSVKGPTHVVRQGKTPLLDAEQTRHLLDSIPLANIVGLRDRAIIGTMVFSFARVGAVAAMNVGDYYLSGQLRFFRLHEKGGKIHQVPAHHNAVIYVGEYLDAAGLWNQFNAPLSQAAGPNKHLTGRPLSANKVLEMVKRRARSAGLPPTTCCHTFRATGITNYLSNGGDVENARKTDSRPPVIADHPAIRPEGRPGDPGRDRADSHLMQIGMSVTPAIATKRSAAARGGALEAAIGGLIWPQPHLEPKRLSSSSSSMRVTTSYTTTTP